MAEFEKSFQDFLDGLSDEELLGYLMLRWTETIPIWERCSKEEYDKHVKPLPDMRTKLTNQDLIDIMANICGQLDYRRVPVWHEGGGILDQISGREPDGYYYEKKVGEKKCIMVGGAMMDYINKRELTKKFKFLKL